ncbi:hypothetical protein [Sphingomonas sp. CFBP 8760]|uniref:hypothetical protein n=1 Tax=Sphingomonas sp. CFBP 8760 TaxID=2775282 RepID=UPI001A9268BD|nr:hypothetical protein [Sphingomonas sp. CFBP 8760]
MATDDQEDLAEVGKLLFGERWQSDLARALGTSSRMMRYWVAGTHGCPPDLRMRLIALLRERGQDVDAMIVRLGRSTGNEK